MRTRITTRTTATAIPPTPQTLALRDACALSTSLGRSVSACPTRSGSDGTVGCASQSNRAESVGDPSSAPPAPHGHIWPTIGGGTHTGGSQVRSSSSTFSCSRPIRSANHSAESGFGGGENSGGDAAGGGSAETSPVPGSSTASGCGPGSAVPSPSAFGGGENSGGDAAGGGSAETSPVPGSSTASGCGPGSAVPSPSA